MMTQDDSEALWQASNLLCELYDCATPAQKSRATRAANAILRAKNDLSDAEQDIRNWSWEERDPALYAELFSKGEIDSTIRASEYIDNL